MIVKIVRAIHFYNDLNMVINTSYKSTIRKSRKSNLSKRRIEKGLKILTMLQICSNCTPWLGLYDVKIDTFCPFFLAARTLEYLETLGVGVLGYQCDDVSWFPLRILRHWAMKNVMATKCWGAFDLMLAGSSFASCVVCTLVDGLGCDQMVCVCVMMCVRSDFSCMSFWFDYAWL